METIKKIVVLGPESTGKSTLCKKLAEHYNTLWVPEYAREYLEKNSAGYQYEDLLKIAKGQIDLEDAICNKARNVNKQPQSPNLNSNTSGSIPAFIDTDMYVMKVWSEFVFNKCDNWILNRIAERKYDLYLLCDIDLPWIADPLREYPEKRIRERLYRFYKDLMVNQSLPWYNISGVNNERLETAIRFIDGVLHKKLL